MLWHDHPLPTKVMFFPLIFRNNIQKITDLSDTYVVKK